MRTGAILCGLAIAATSIAAGATTAAAQQAHGTHFGIAGTSSPSDDPAGAVAFPGARAIWAGTCDLGDPSTSAGGVGTVPAEPFAHCIDHPGQAGTSGTMPPLVAGVSGGSYLFEGIGPGWQNAPSWRLDPEPQAAAHPDATLSFWMARGRADSGNATPDGDPRDATVKLPAGLVGDPSALPQCPAEVVERIPVPCPPETQVGVVTVHLGTNYGQPSVSPVYNVEPRRGKPAEFIFTAGDSTYRANIPVTARVRTDGDFGVDTLVTHIPSNFPLLGQTITIWGVPWARHHDAYRAPQSYPGHSTGNGGSVAGFQATGLPAPSATGEIAEPRSWEPAWGPVEPFLTLPSECSGELLTTRAELTSWHRRDIDGSYPWFGFDAPADVPVDGCAGPGFEADLDLAATSTMADGPTGLHAELSTPQNDVARDAGGAPLSVPDVGAPTEEADDYVAEATSFWGSDAGLGRSHLDKVVVTLPEGMSVNPSGATGLAGCSDAGIGLREDGSPPLFNAGDPFDGASDGAECPAASVIGKATVRTPLLQETLTGEVVLGEPRSTDPSSGQMFRMFVVVRNRERGLLAKIFGSAVADPRTGRLTATFDQNPQVPLERLELDMKGGQRGLLAQPQRCGAGHGWSASLSPWTTEHAAGGQAVADGGDFATASNCAFGFAPELDAGMSGRQARGTGTFSLRFARRDGEQWLRGVSVEMPEGLLAAVGDVALCSNAQAAANSCPAASRIGVADAGAGSGDPFFLERKGSVYLTEGYKGAPYGLAVSIPVEAGPFRGKHALSPIVVRQALHVDRTSAKVTAVSDPFPLIHHGIPLRAREVMVKIDRPGFMRNSSSCSAKRISARLVSATGAAADRARPFQAAGCARLGFKPKLAMRLTGRKQTTTRKHPGVRAVVTQKSQEAGIERAEVRLPSKLVLDIDNAKGICEFTDGIKDEPTCPKASIVGRASAVSPLLSRPLRGNVYFVKNVRIDPRTGAQRRTLPMIVVALRGEIAVNLKGKSNVKGGRLVSTFASLPDAPLSRFRLRIAGGRGGILAITSSRRGPISICSARQTAEADMDAHNGRRHDRNVVVKTPCSRRAR